MIKKFIFSTKGFAIFIIFLMLGCKENRLDVNISDIEVKLNIKHFEQDLFENKISNYEQMKLKYGYFIDDYTNIILGFQGDSMQTFNQLMLFKSDQNARKIYNEVQKKYNNFKPYEEELTKAYQYFKFYFPQEKIPAIITYTSNFSYSMNPVGNDYIGIALDMHLGANFKPYDFENIENYWKKILIPESIVPNHMMAHANDLFAYTNTKETFADEMIYYGKLLYFLDATIPSAADEIKIGMTKAEFDWCKKEEKNIWAFIVKEKYLYETESKKYEKLLHQGPKTILNGVPPDAPAMLGRYIGWMIVRQLMNENIEISLLELMRDKNAKGIIQKSGYKPN